MLGFLYFINCSSLKGLLGFFMCWSICNGLWYLAIWKGFLACDEESDSTEKTFLLLPRKANKNVVDPNEDFLLLWVMQIALVRSLFVCLFCENAVSPSRVALLV